MRLAISRSRIVSGGLDGLVEPGLRPDRLPLARAHALLCPVGGQAPGLHVVREARLQDGGQTPPQPGLDDGVQDLQPPVEIAQVGFDRQIHDHKGGVRSEAVD